jgi:hypothetical protein
LNRRTRARIDCIRKLRASRPWLTSMDWELILLGWEQGCQFGTSLMNDTQESKALP